MSLTPEQRLALCRAVGCMWEEVLARDLHAFAAGLRMGRAEGREQAAKACDHAAAQWEDTEQAMSIAAESLASEIRALPEEPT